MPPFEKDKQLFIKSLRNMYLEWTLLQANKKGEISVTPELIVYDFLKIAGLHNDDVFEYITGKKMSDCGL